jgi:hypothetical protein
VNTGGRGKGGWLCPQKPQPHFLFVATIPKNSILISMKADEEKQKQTYARFLAWKLRNAEKNQKYQKEYNKKYREDNKEELNKKGVERQKRRRIENPEKVKAAERKYRERNTDKERERKAKWRIDNPSKTKENKIARKSKLRLKPENKNQRPVMNVIYKCAQRISKCIGIEFHVDHIMPLAHNGEHVASNLQILPGKINLRKSAKIPSYLYINNLTNQPIN